MIVNLQEVIGQAAPQKVWSVPCLRLFSMLQVPKEVVKEAKAAKAKVADGLEEAVTALVSCPQMLQNRLRTNRILLRGSQLNGKIVDSVWSGKRNLIVLGSRCVRVQKKGESAGAHGAERKHRRAKDGKHQRDRRQNTSRMGLEV